MRAIQGGKGSVAFEGSAAVSLSAVDVQRAGFSIKVALVIIGEHEGLTTKQAAELFNVSESTILKHIQNHAITTGKIFRNMLQLLKSNGIIAKQAPHAIFIPRQGLRELMRIIDTDEAKAAYHQLFDDAEELLRIKPLYLEQEKLLKKLEQQNEVLRHERNEALLQSEWVIEQNLQVMTQNQQYARIFKAGKRRCMRLRAMKRAAEELALNPKKKRGENRKKVLIYESTGRNIFEGEQFRAVAKYRKKSEMTPEEANIYKIQHTSRSMVGMAESGVHAPLIALGTSDSKILEAAANIMNGARQFMRAVMPEVGDVKNKNSVDLRYLN